MIDRCKSFLQRSNDAALMCFGVAFGAFIAAGMGALVNHLLAGWFAVGGMVGVGLLYLGMGLYHFASRGQQPGFSNDTIETAVLHTRGRAKTDVPGASLPAPPVHRPAEEAVPMLAAVDGHVEM